MCGHTVDASPPGKLTGRAQACQNERLRRLSAWRFGVSSTAVVTGILLPFPWRGVAPLRRPLNGLESGVAELQLGVVRLQLAVSGFQIQDVDDASQIHALVDKFGDPLEALEVVSL